MSNHSGSTNPVLISGSIDPEKDEFFYWDECEPWDNIILNPPLEPSPLDKKIQNMLGHIDYEEQPNWLEDSFSIGDLVKLDPALFPPTNPNRTSYYSIPAMEPDAIGIVVEKLPPYQFHSEPMYKVLWNDGGFSIERHWDLVALSKDKKN